MPSLRRFARRPPSLSGRARPHREVKDELVAEEKAHKTITKQISALHTVLEWAVSNDLIPFNPVRGVKLATGRVAREKRLPYDMDDLNRIFASPVYTKGDRPKAGAGDAAFWLPLLGLFTGARLEELGQALVEDVKQIDGVAVLEISDRSEGKKLKNAAAGFLRYVEGVGTAGHTRLFPELKPDQWGGMTGNWSKWWGRYACEVIGITDERKVFHSLRHSFKDQCRACNIEEAVHDALTGHSGGGVGRSYGGLTYPLSPLVAAINNLAYAGLELSHLHQSSTKEKP